MRSKDGNSKTQGEVLVIRKIKPLNIYEDDFFFRQGLISLCLGWLWVYYVVKDKPSCLHFLSAGITDMCKIKVAKILTDEGIVHKSQPYLRSYWWLVAVGKGRVTFVQSDSPWEATHAPTDDPCACRSITKDIQQMLTKERESELGGENRVDGEKSKGKKWGCIGSKHTICMYEY